MTKSRKTEAATTEPQQLGAAADEVIERAKETLGAEAANQPSQFPAERPTVTGNAEAALSQKKPFQPVARLDEPQQATGAVP